MEKSAGIVLYRNNKENKREFLILKYADYEDYWGLCKGNIDKGETKIEAALREAEEETGLTDIETDLIFKEKTSYFYTRNGKKINKEVTWFLGKVLSGSAKISSEHTELIWLNYEETISKIKHKKDVGIVKKSEELLNLKN